MIGFLLEFDQLSKGNVLEGRSDGRTTVGARRGREAEVIFMLLKLRVHVLLVKPGGETTEMERMGTGKGGPRNAKGIQADRALHLWFACGGAGKKEGGRPFKQFLGGVRQRT